MTVRNPQLFNSADVNDIQKFVDDPEWALEQKVDGMRCLTVITPDSIEFYTRGGKPLNSSAAKLHFEKMRSILSVFQSRMSHIEDYELVLDAELMTDQGKLVLLDMPYYRARPHVPIGPGTPFTARRTKLTQFWERILAYNIDVLPVLHAATTFDKLRLVDRVMKAGGEGLMAKRLDSPYIEGVRVKHSLKLKFTATADVVVLAKNSGESKHSKRGGDKINFEFGVYGPDPLADEGFPWKLHHIGNCSGIGKENAEVGDVIEVEYLYVGAGGKLTQPRMLRRRDDKQPEDCTADQLKTYSKEVL